ncbi:MAG TPA: hypothetical protein DCL43_06025 [Chitinophagaceae bacterium]|nr:hypothetical protein [Chitinophagaceae bacterium]HAN39789.1 hypothetical protein [Chitinophagaceae bacterium]
MKNTFFYIILLLVLLALSCNKDIYEIDDVDSIKMLSHENQIKSLLKKSNSFIQDGFKSSEYLSKDKRKINKANTAYNRYGSDSLQNFNLDYTSLKIFENDTLLVNVVNFKNSIGVTSKEWKLVRIKHKVRNIDTLFLFNTRSSLYEATPFKYSDFYHCTSGSLLGSIAATRKKALLKVNYSDQQNKSLGSQYRSECSISTREVRYLYCDMPTGQNHNNTVCHFINRIYTTYTCPTPDLSSLPEPVQWMLISQIGVEGGGSVEIFEDVYENQEIIDSLQGYPCAQEILKQLPNINESTDSILNKVFKSSSKVNLILAVDPSLSTQTDDAITSPPVILNGVMNIRIRCNPTFLSNASKELIAAVLFHEAIHGYINFQISRYRSGEVDSNFLKTNFPLIWQYKNGNNSQHLTIASAYRDEIKRVITYFNGNLNSTISNALAFKGLTGTPSWIALGNDTVTTRQILYVAKYGRTQEMRNLGLTKCN